MTSEVVKKESTEVANFDFKMDQPILSEEIIIPKILVMQPGSTLVTKSEAVFGQMIDSMSGEVLGDFKNPLKFIPFYFERVYYISKKEGTRFKFDRLEPYTIDDRKYEETINGVTYKNEKAWQYYVMLTDDMSIPRIITFKGMSRRAGEVLYTDAYVKSAMLKKRHVDFVYELAGQPHTNEKGTFAKISAKKSRATTMEELKDIHPWFMAVKEGLAKSHNSANDEEETSTAREHSPQVNDIPDQF